jgi:FlaA1/EpsC-like NDP-sugar epimerase
MMQKLLINFFEIIQPKTQTEKILFLAAIDACIIYISCILAFYLRLDAWWQFNQPILRLTLISLVIIFSLAKFTDHFNRLYRHFDHKDLLSILNLSLFYLIILVVILLLVNIDGIPRSLSVITPIIFCLLQVLKRLFLFRLNQWLIPSQNQTKKNILIYGAGVAGIKASSYLSRDDIYNIVGFIDDNMLLHKKRIGGKIVYSPIDIFDVIFKNEIKEIFISIPSLTSKKRLAIYEKLKETRLPIKILDGKEFFLNTKKYSFKSLDINDLLARDEIKPIQNLLEKCIKGKNVLVTGAGGSIGSELCRQILKLKPKHLFLFEVNEFALYSINQELIEFCTYHKQNIVIYPLLGSCSNDIRVSEILKKWTIDTIYHAAAYKHVPMVEYNFFDGLSNNILSTYVIASLSIKHKVKNFVLISSDKAVRPSNIMGVTKRISEVIIQSLSAQSNSNLNFSIVRFGNVLGSSGSVVPLFQEQIIKNKQITLTHPDVTRFFMTIEEAASLVIQAASMTEDKIAPIYILDMGQPIKIIDLAYRIVDLLGFSVKNKSNPNGVVSIKTIGLRPGEKLHEELIIEGKPELTEHPLIMKVDIPSLQIDIHKTIKNIHKAITLRHVRQTFSLIKKIVPEYNEKRKIIDWVYRQ